MDTNMGELGQLKQRFQETVGDRLTRKAEGFESVESGLPTHIGDRFDIPFVDNVTSLLGKHNPLAQEVNPKIDSVWLLDNTAHRPTTGTEHHHQHHHFFHHDEEASLWQAEFVAAYFVKDTGKDLSAWVSSIAEKIGIGEDVQGESRKQIESRIAERLRPLVTTVEPARWVNVKFKDGTVHKLGPGGYNGISTDILTTPGKQVDGDQSENVTVPEEIAPLGDMLTHFAEPEGWAVVSDIDDSIKITMTSSPIGILKSTFVDDPVPIKGMPELYKHVQETLSPAWFYLSASPYNLYQFLRPFLHEHYPKGTIILRDANWLNLSGFLQSLTQGTQAYKDSRMEKVQSWLPKRKMLCVGDSTQSDPEVYGDMYRKFGPDWVKRVFIRKVTGISELHETDKNEPSRFEKAFEGVPKEVWTVFEDPSELMDAVSALKDM
ncbi:hypothetical protein MMC25_005101 [Agyrium rufum]|nr:hypothetical protein [Agyrium rufum]